MSRSPVSCAPSCVEDGYKDDARRQLIISGRRTAPISPLQGTETSVHVSDTPNVRFGSVDNIDNTPFWDATLGLTSMAYYSIGAALLTWVAILGFDGAAGRPKRRRVKNLQEVVERPMPVLETL